MINMTNTMKLRESSRKSVKEGELGEGGGGELDIKTKLGKKI